MTNQASDRSPWAVEADTFIAIMRDLAPDLRLDYSPRSLTVVERFIETQFDPPGSTFVGEGFITGLGCYVGEVIIRTLGGHWNAQGGPIINAIGPIQAIAPIQKVTKRFTNGSEDALPFYYETVARYARGGPPVSA